VKLVRVTALRAYQQRLRIPRGCVKRVELHADCVWIDRRRLKRARRD
jgi:hypothetical protein